MVTQIGSDLFDDDDENVWLQNEIIFFLTQIHCVGLNGRILESGNCIRVMSSSVIV